MYHILYVDDEPGLLEVGKLFLEHCGEFFVDTVTSAPEALTLLAIKNYDGIISDYQMPDMDGIEFLKIIRASGKTIPFILFTGRGREEVVIQALNEGADFYLQKGGEPQSQFTELTNKVRYAIMRRSAEESLKQNEAQLRQIIDLVPHLIFVKAINGNYLLANRASAERYNTDVATLVGKSQSVFHGNSVELQRILDDDRDVITTGTTKFIPEDPYTDTSGNLRFFQTTKVPFTTVGSNQQAVLGVAIDITKSKQVEKALRESKERYRRIVETTDEGIFQLGENLETVYVNRKMAEMHGCTPGEIIGKSITLFMAADDLPEHSRHMQERRQGKSGRYERRYITKDGQVRWMQVSATPLMDPDGTFRGSFAMCSDITERKTAEVEIARRNEELRAAYEQLRATENELKQNYNKLVKGQNLLEESEQRYRNVVEDQTEFISRFLPNGTHVFVNEAYCRYFGLKRDEIVGHRLRPKIPVETRERLNLFFASLTRDHPIDTIEHPIIMPDGSIRWHRWSDRAIFDRFGTVIEYQSVGRDITKEKETQIALEKSEKRFRDLSDLLPVIVYEVDINGNLKYANHIAFELFGYTEDDFRRGLNIRQMIAPEDREQAGVDFRAMVEGKGGQRGPAEEYLALRKDGITFPISIYASPISVNGRITGFRGILVDITERRKAENALRESQRKLADAIDLANLVTWEHDFKTGNLTFDDRFSTLYGMNAEPNCINHMTVAAYLQKTVHPEDLHILLEEDEKTRTTPDPHYVSKREYRIIRGDGEIRRIEMCVGVTKDAEGRTIKTHGVNQDVTERENAKEALRESEEKFRSFVENSNDILYSTTPEGIFTYISPKLTELTGQNTSEILGKSFESLVFSDDPCEDRESLYKAFTSAEKMSGIEYRTQHKNGTWQWHSATASPVRDAEGKIVAIVGSIRDITERKKAEEALRRANRQLSLLSGITRHDILNKLTCVLGYLKLAEVKSGDPTLNAYLEKIGSAVTEIQSQIEFNRIYQDLVTHEPQWLELDAAIPRFRIPEKIALNADIPKTDVFADPMIEKIFSNLLDNSIRHGQHVTEITVSTKKSGKDLVIVWEDNGIGVADDEKDLIFERGFGKNTGLGLFLSREILSLTEITIRETGTPGKGVRFEITVPKGHYRFSHQKSKNNHHVKGQ